MPDSMIPLDLVKVGSSLDIWSRGLPFPAGPLYHYTTVSGFLGIINSGHLWATHGGFLNDPGESVYGMEVLREYLGVSCVVSYFEEIGDAVRSLPNALKALPSASSYLTCFTEIPDSLVLWNMYTPEASGVAIEFNSVRLIASARALTS